MVIRPCASISSLTRSNSYSIWESVSCFLKNKDQVPGSRGCKADREGRIEMLMGQPKCYQNLIYEFLRRIFRGRS